MRPGPAPQPDRPGPRTPVGGWRPIVAQAAAQNGVPFLGIRAASDGNGDPLHLPGFPAQFFVYRQLAGNNAAAVAVAFLRQWAADGYPTASSHLKKPHPAR